MKLAVDEDRLDRGRYDSYLKLLRETVSLEKQQTERALLDRKRQGKIGAKAYRAMEKKRGPKGH